MVSFTLMDPQTTAQSLYRGEALAPMVRASTTPLRHLALQYGADFVYTEELMDRALLEAKRVVHENGWIDYVKDLSKMSEKVRKRLNDRPPVLLRIDRTESSRLIGQIGTGSPELAVQAARVIAQDVTAIDVNMGCPKKFSVSGGMGSALLKDPDRAAAIVEALAKAMHPKPVSAKIRLLATHEATILFCDKLIEAGASALAIHGRHVGDEGTQPAHWDKLRLVVKELSAKYPSTPILVNGDFYTRQEFQDFVNDTGARGVLLGRPALYNTSIFRKPTSGEVDLGYQSPLLLDKATVVQDYVKLCVKYDNHFKNVKYVIGEMMSQRRTPIPRVPFLPQNYPGGQSIGKTCDCKSLDEVCRLWEVEPVGPETSQAAPAGEHRYEDSYFVTERGEEGTATDKTPVEPSRKRVKVDS